MQIVLLKTAAFLAEEIFDHGHLVHFNSDHMDFGKDLSEGFMMGTDRGLVVVGTDEDEICINVMVIHLGTGSKRLWKDFDDVYMGEEILDFLCREDKRVLPIYTPMKMWVKNKNFPERGDLHGQ